MVFIEINGIKLDIEINEEVVKGRSKL